jgi:hypothetical protein
MTVLTYPRSFVEKNGSKYFLTIDKLMGAKSLGVSGDISGFQGRPGEEGALLCPLSYRNAATLRLRLPWLCSTPLGLMTSAGFGDRLGLATPGHVRAVRDSGILPIFAQQSVRENVRTGRTPQRVYDDAMWGVFQEGWHDSWGADADHIKSSEEIKPFVMANYTYYTIDPGEHVHAVPKANDRSILLKKSEEIPWKALDITLEGLKRLYLDHPFHLERFDLLFDERTLLRALVKYGSAIAHVAVMFNEIQSLMGHRPFELEISLDETAIPTSIYEHFFVASELKRIGVNWVGLAPRFTGRFEKGVDYIGDLKELETGVAGHASVMRSFGNYKLSLHSGSDKFSVYPILAKYANHKVHVKTAGTSYLEALRIVARVSPAFFREVLELSRQCYEVDRATYYVSAQPRNIPLTHTIPDEDLPELLNQFDARQVLHVAFGSVLSHFRDRLFRMLEGKEETYYKALEDHFAVHLSPFAIEQKS